MGYSIEHSGILGMKWGKRNGPPYPLDSAQKSSAEKTAEKTGESPNPDSKKYYTPKASELWEKKDELSTQEINDFINRINAETRLKDLVDKENPKNTEQTQETKKADSLVKRTMKSAGTMFVENAVKAGSALVVGKAIEKAFGRDMAEAIAGDKYTKLSPAKKEYKLLTNDELKKNFDNMSNKEIGDQQTRQKLHDNIFGTSSTTTSSSNSTQTKSNTNSSTTSSKAVKGKSLSGGSQKMQKPWAATNTSSLGKVASKTSEFAERVAGTRTDISQHNIDLAKQWLYGDDWFKHSEVE